MTNYERILVEEKKIEEDFIKLRNLSDEKPDNYGYLACVQDIVQRIEGRQKQVFFLMSLNGNAEYKPDLVEELFGIGEF